MPDMKTSALATAAALTGAELVAGVQTGADVKITVDQIRAGMSARAYTRRVITVSYTLVVDDAINIILHSTSATGITITVPADTVAIPQEVPIPWRAFGAGQITFAAGAGATLLSRGNVFKSAGQYAEGVLTKPAVDTWLLAGDITA